MIVLMFEKKISKLPIIHNLLYSSFPNKNVEMLLENKIEIIVSIKESEPTVKIIEETKLLFFTSL